MTIEDVKKNILNNPDHWKIYLMDFVDDLRYSKDSKMIESPIALSHEKFDALLASTVSYLCDEMSINIPEWVHNVPPCKHPWFIAGMENLKAIAIVESPVHFRIRKIFVLENFLSRA